MAILQYSFWALAVLVGYAYVGYPVLLAIAAKLRGRPVQRGPFGGSFSVVVAAMNEERNIGRRVRELVALIAATKVPGELIVVSDGSTDNTAEVARAEGAATTRVIALPTNAGKANALNTGCAAATGDVIVFADSRQTWSTEAMACLLENFADPAVGAATGELVLDSGSDATEGVGLYWRYEKWIRHNEGVLWSVVGATGAISAVRRELFQPIPLGMILDDVYWPMRVVMQGRRVVPDYRARAYDRLPEKAKDEFRRKVRTLSGNFQLAARVPALLVPWRNPVWVQFVSHKLLRLVVPWALIGMLVCSAVLAWRSPIYLALLVAQLVGYAVGTAGALGVEAVGRIKGGSAAASFLVLNAAAWMGFWVWISGRAGRSWKKVQYEKGHAGAGASTAPAAAGSAATGGASMDRVEVGVKQ